MKTILERKVANEAMTRAVMQKIYQEHLSALPVFTLFFEGGLGAGKTFCVRELLRVGGVEGPITSPTYTYVQTYETEKNTFAHFDLYRIGGDTDFFEKGFQDIATDDQIIKLVEWPHRLEKLTLDQFSAPSFVLKIDHGLGASMRTISFLE